MYSPVFFEMVSEPMHEERIAASERARFASVPEGVSSTERTLFAANVHCQLARVLGMLGLLRSRLRGLLSLALDRDPDVPRVAVKNRCPCHAHRHVSDVWERLPQVASDPSPGVRMDVLRNRTDASPLELTGDVVVVVEALRNDPTPECSVTPPF